MMVYIPDALRDVVVERADGLCEYCQAPFAALLQIEIDHIQPTSKGGLTIEQNLCAVCSLCNNTKSDHRTGIDPATKTEIDLFNPRIQIWRDHFQWSEDYLMIIPLTDAGRATVERLKLNDAPYLIARPFWRRAGWQPSG